MGRGGPDQRGRGGQGHYRRLWAEVTRVGRGQKLGEGDGPFSDSSVEEMLQVIRSLPPEASAVTAISQGLYYLDRCAAWADVARSGHCLPAVAGYMRPAARLPLVSLRVRLGHLRGALILAAGTLKSVPVTAQASRPSWLGTREAGCSL